MIGALSMTTPFAFTVPRSSFSTWWVTRPPTTPPPISQRECRVRRYRRSRRPCGCAAASHPTPWGTRPPGTPGRRLSGSHPRSGSRPSLTRGRRGTSAASRDRPSSHPGRSRGNRRRRTRRSGSPRAAGRARRARRTEAGWSGTARRRRGPTQDRRSAPSRPPAGWEPRARLPKWAGRQPAGWCPARARTEHATRGARRHRWEHRPHRACEADGSVGGGTGCSFLSFSLIATRFPHLTSPNLRLPCKLAGNHTRLFVIYAAESLKCRLSLRPAPHPSVRSATSRETSRRDRTQHRHHRSAPHRRTRVPRGSITSTVPPCAATIAATMASPSPVPLLRSFSSRRVRAVSAR